MIYFSVAMLKFVWHRLQFWFITNFLEKFGSFALCIWTPDYYLKLGLFNVFSEREVVRSEIPSFTKEVYFYNAKLS